VAKKSKQKGVGGWAFIIGLVIAVLVGLFSTTTAGVIWLLVVLGIVVGFLNVGDREATTFLVASIALMLAGSANLTILWGPIGNVLSNLVVFVSPAAVIVAVKSIYETAKF